MPKATAIVGSWIPTGNDQPRLQMQLRTCIAQLSQAAGAAQALSNILAQMALGEDYTTIEVYFGVPTGTGQTLKDVLGTANTVLQGTSIQGLLQRFG